VPILNPFQFDLVRPLLQPLDHYLAATAILEGSAPAAVYVDDPAHPAAAFKWTGYRFFLAGSPQQAAFNEEVRALLAKSIAPRALASGLELVELKMTPDDWEAHGRATILQGHKMISAQRQYFRFAALRHDWRALLPAGLHLAVIGPDLLARKDWPIWTPSERSCAPSGLRSRISWPGASAWLPSAIRMRHWPAGVGRSTTAGRPTRGHRHAGADVQHVGAGLDLGLGVGEEPAEVARGDLGGQLLAPCRVDALAHDHKGSVRADENGLLRGS
jgi:hypothetical protein